MIDSIELTNRVIDRLGNEVPMFDGKVHLHPVIRIACEILAEEGVVDLDRLGEEE